MIRSLTCLFLSALSAPLALAQTALTATTIATGLSNPVHVTAPAGDRTRVFVVEQTGAIRVIKNGSLLQAPFLHLGHPASGGLNKISFGGEQGLFSLAFHPQYDQNRACFVSYTDLGGNSVIERYLADPANPDVAQTWTGTTILGPVFQPQSNHNGGALAFGPDGKLYVGLGDGGGDNDQGFGHLPGGNAQAGSTLLGKILRLDVDLPPPYVPGDNPFVGVSGFLPEIWALGLRNPWRMAFDRLTGDLYIGDVGQSHAEEIDFQPAFQGGLNYGWSCMEATQCTGFGGCNCNAPSLTSPIHQYAHTGGCFSVTGGHVYRGCAMPALQGTYFLADYCLGAVWSFRYTSGNVSEFTNRTNELSGGQGFVGNISSFGEDADGELYMTDLSGSLLKIVPAAAPADCNGNGLADACDISQGASQDLNGNGVPDECECPLPQLYCSSQVNSLGCTPELTYAGSMQLGSPQQFLITARNILPQQFGILFYGTQPNGVPFMGGTLCVKQPITRTPVQNSRGGGSACTGKLSLDFKAWTQSGIDPGLVVGQDVFAQFWSRDAAAPSTTNLTGAIRFTICQ